MEQVDWVKVDKNFVVVGLEGGECSRAVLPVQKIMSVMKGFMVNFSKGSQLVCKTMRFSHRPYLLRIILPHRPARPLSY